MYINAMKPFKTLAADPSMNLMVHDDFKVQ